MSVKKMIKKRKKIKKKKEKEKEIELVKEKVEEKEIFKEKDKEIAKEKEKEEEEEVASSDWSRVVAQGKIEFPTVSVHARYNSKLCIAAPPSFAAIAAFLFMIYRNGSSKVDCIQIVPPLIGADTLSFTIEAYHL